MRTAAIDPFDPNKRIAFSASVDGLAVEHVIRTGSHNMKTKHFHPEYEIFYILEGTRQFFFSNRSFIASSGDLIVIDSNMVHMTRSEENDAGHNRIIVYITPSRMEYLDNTYLHMNLSRFIHEHYGIYHLDKKQHTRFMDFYYLFKREYRQKHIHYAQAIELAASAWLLHLKRDLENTNSGNSKYQENERYRHVYDIADYLSANLAQNISLQELSEHFFLSPSYICRVFKEVTGYNIREFVNINRISRSKIMLETTEHSIGLIAELVGYESVTHFERVFRSYMSISPLKYRKMRDVYVSSIIPAE